MTNKIDRIVKLMVSDDSVDAPVSSMKWVKDIYRVHGPEKKAGLLRKLVAVLTLDLSASTPVYGERSASAARERQLLFSAGETGLDVRIVAEKRKNSIRGQVLSDDFAGAQVTLAIDDQEHESTITNVGGFLFESIPSGHARLLIRSDEVEIRTEDFEI